MASATLRSGWSRGSLHIVVIDAWLANAGDAAIALATLRRLRRLAPEASIVLAAYQADRLAGYYPGLPLVPPAAALVGCMPGELLRLGWTANMADELIGGADAVLSQGGGFLLEPYRPLARLCSYRAFIELGLPLAFCAQTIGRFQDRESCEILGNALRSAVAVSVRDKHSAEVVRTLYRREDIFVTADDSFSLFRLPPVAAPVCGVGVVLTEHPLITGDGNHARMPQREQLVNLVEQIAEVVPEERLVLFSTTQGLGAGSDAKEDDAEVAEAVVRGLPRALQARVEMPTGYLNVERCAAIIAGLRGLVSLRMHPVIMGLSLGVPSLLVGASGKASRFEEMGIHDVVLDAAPGDPVVAAALRRALDDPRRRGLSAWASLRRARRLAAGNDEVVVRMLDLARQRARRRQA
jgi:polysaccharide pyruvyl transferase WcaK-like protein